MYPDIKNKDLLKNILKKKEFIELIDKDNDKINYKYKILDKYQEFVRRYISPYTYYDRLLLFHSTGTGKSFAAISVAETHKTYKDNCLILVKGKTSELNFKNLIKEFCYKNNLEINKNDKYYEFDRFIRFSKKLSNKTDDEIIKDYSNKIIIIDEAHNIKSDYSKNDEDNNIYDNIYNMLHIINNTKVLYLTATPMVDNYNEIFSLLNLILNEENKIVPNDYEKIENLKERINGIISYCDTKYNIPNVEIKGIKLPNLNFKVYVSFMKGFQLKAWKKIKGKKKHNDPVHKNRIYCSTIVSENLKYGNEMKNECLNEIEIKNYGKKFILKNKVNINLENIDKYSCKFASMIKISLLCNGCIYVFCEDIEGSGLKMLSAILENIGYTMFTNWNNDTIKGKRFILCTGDESITPKIDYLINNFCKEENKNGEYIKFFLGSRVVSESINLKNVRQVHVLTPHWNLPVINQAIGRSIRTFSHNSLDKHLRKVDIFLHCAIGIDNNFDMNTLFNATKMYENSVDYYKYNCAQLKYNKIKRIINILKDTSINRFLNYKQIKDVKIDYFTYRAFYSNSLSNYIIGLIKNEINTGYNYILKSSIVNKLNIDTKIIDEILHKKIINKIIIKDNYEQFKKILYNDGIIYFDKYSNKNNDINIHLVKYYSKKSKFIIKNDILNINLKLNNKQEKILKNYNIINLNLIKKMFEFNIKELIELLEYGIINNISLIYDYFKSFLIYNNNTLYHNLCYFSLDDKICSYSISSGNYSISEKTRKYDEKKKIWKYISDNDLELLLKNKNKHMLKESNNNLKVYLLISNADKYFRLCNKITENTYKSKNDNRSRNRGKTLESYTPKELNDIFIYLLKKISYVGFLNLKDILQIKKNNILHKSTIQEIIKYILFTNKMYLIH